MRALLAFVFTALLQAQTVVYLRHGEPGSAIRITGASNATPISITTDGAHGLSAGQTVWIQGVEGNFAANGSRKVKATSGADMFTITDLNGVDIAGSGTYSRGVDVGIVGPTQPVTLREHPRVWLDGPSGTITSGLAAKAVTGNPPWDDIVATVNQNANSYLQPDPALAAYMGNAQWQQTTGAALKWFVTGDATALAEAKAFLLDLDNVSSYGRLGCDLAVSQCGANGAQTDYGATDAPYIMQAYSIIRSQFTPAEKQKFLDMVLNDNQYAYPTTEPQCGNQAKNGIGTVSTVAGTKIISYSDPAMDSVWTVGTQIWLTSNSFIGKITAVNTDARTITTDLAQSTNAAIGTKGDVSFYYIKPWASGDCGFVWYMKHHAYWPGPVGAWYYNGGPNNYLAGTTYGGASNSWTHNHHVARALTAVSIGVALADDDPRARDLLEMAYNWFFDRVYTTGKAYWSGMAQQNEGYFMGRVYTGMAGSVAIANASLGIDLFSDGWLKNSLLYMIYGNLPHRYERPRYGPPNSGAQQLYPTQYVGMFIGMGLYAGSDEAGYAYKLTRDVLPLASNVSQKMWTAAGLNRQGAVPFIFTDPSASSLSLNNLPRQVVLNSSPVAKYPAANTSVMISRTGWPSGIASNSDTWTWLYAPDQYTGGLINSGGGAPLHYDIIKNRWLFAGDWGVDNCGTGVFCYAQDLDKTAYIEIGGTNNLVQATGVVNQNLEISRFAGDSQNRYAYALGDATAAYKAAVGPIRVHRHFLDLKKPGTQQFIVVFDDVRTSTPQLKRTFLQYPQNGGTGEGNTAYDSASGTIVSNSPNASLVSKVLLPSQPARFSDLGVFRCPGASPCPESASTNTLLFAKSASANYPYTYQAGPISFTFTSPVTLTLSGSASGTAYFYLTPEGQLTVGHNGLGFQNLTGIVENAGVTGFPLGSYPLLSWMVSNGVWAAEGVYAGMTLSSTAGQTRRFIVSDGTTTESEFLVVHMPGGGGSPRLPDTTLLPNPDGKFEAVQIAGDDPKVALFPRDGLLYNSATFTATFGGTAQIFIAGLAAGHYQVSRGGSTIAADITVKDKDNTLYFESVGGTFQVSEIGMAPPLAMSPPPSLPDGTAGIEYSQVFGVSGGVPPYSWSIAGGEMPPGLTLLTPEGVLQGIPTAEGQYSFTVRVQDGAVPPSSVQVEEALDILPAPRWLTVTVDGISTTGAIVHYGIAGLDAAQTCTIVVATEESFANPVEQYTDQGGGAMRDYVMGQFAPLLPNALYYVNATCGPPGAIVSFLTMPEGAGNLRSFEIRLGPPQGLPVASVLIDYGPTAVLGTQVKVGCSSLCSARIFSLPSGLLYYQRTYLDADDRVIARSSRQTIRAPY